MRTFATLLTLLLIALAPAAAGGSGVVNVTVQVGDLYHALPAETRCDVAVPAGANAGDALDAAVASGCLGSWAYATFAGFGRYVTCIDGECENAALSWVFSENGATASYGIDSAVAAEGDVFDFRYGPLTSFFLP